MKVAQIENNKVINIIDIDDTGIPLGVSVGEYCASLFPDTNYQWAVSTDERPARIGGGYDIDHDAFVDTPKPGPWAYLNDDHEWAADFPINVHTGQELTHDELAYIGYFTRHTKGYRLCPAVLKDPDDALTSAACLTNSYMYPTFETITYGTNTVANLVPHQVTGNQVVVNTNFAMSKYLDVTPIGLILKTTFEVYNDVTNPIMNMHPQTAARTPHELFRLIIEWAWAHTDLGNKEAASKVCHDLLRAVQMPIEVRNELLTQVEPQAVERYIRGLDPFYATDTSIISDPPMPPLFSAWIQPTRDTFRYKVAPPEDVSFNYEVIDYESLPTDYPR